MYAKISMIFMLLMLAFTVKADICEDINDLANEWNDVANFIDEVGDAEFTDSELRTLERYVTDLAEDTYILADALIDLGNNRETKLGVNLRKAMQRVADAETTDSMVRNLDSLVDAIDRTTDYCDQ